MRVLYFSRDYTPHDHRFLSALASSGHQIGYLRLEQSSQVFEDRPIPPGVELIHWKGGRSTARWQQYLQLRADLHRVIGSFKPDLIQAGPIQTAAFLVALTGFRPLVSTSWGYDLLLDAQRSRFWSWVTRFTLKRSTVFVGDCETIRKRAISYGMCASRIVTFPWGVDLQHFTPKEDPELRTRLGWGKDTFVLISTRSWSPIYGVESLARSFVQLAPRFPELRLLMLGNGPQAGLIRRIFLQVDVLDRVHFPGQVKQADLPRYYRAADLYISTSHSDGTSISLLEAMACGLPVLVSDIPGNREWITPGEQGWWFSDGSTTSLAETLASAVLQRQKLPEMGKAARRTAEARADWEHNFPRLLEAYELAVRLNSPG